MVPLRDNRKQVRWVLVVTLCLNILVLLIKIGVGWWTGSLSLLADALHSVTDSASNILGLITSQLASPYPDRDHPYGHHKFDAIGAMGIAVFLGIACFEILQAACQRLWGNNIQVVEMSAPALWLTFVVLGVNLFVAFYERREGQRLGSSILVADANHTMSDIWVTLVVIVGLIGVWNGWQWLDIVLAFPVAIMVFRSGWIVLKTNLPWLVDQMAIAPEAIHAAVMTVPGVINCHSIASRGMLGRQVFIDMHLIVNAVDVETAHTITEMVEAHLEAIYAPVRVTIHVEPPEYREDNISYTPDSPSPNP